MHRRSQLIGFTLILGAAGWIPAHAGVDEYIAAMMKNLPPAVVIEGSQPPARPLLRRMRALHVPGVSIAVIHDGAIAWARGFGVTRIGGPPVTPDTLFQAGSISKPVATLAALRLVEQGTLDLDADVNRTLKSWQLPGTRFTEQTPVTLRMLLTHTAGLTVHGFWGYESGEALPTLRQSLDGVEPANNDAVRVEATPGTQWRYSGGGYLILQQMLLDATGRDLPSLLRDTVLQPLGMTRSSYEQPLPETRASDSATPYDGDGVAIAGGPHLYPELTAAGLWTTPSDLARFAIGLQRARAGKEGSILGPAMAAEMLTPGAGAWGLGIEIGGATGARYFRHDGANAGFQNLIVAYENGDGAAIMANSNRGSQLASEILRAIAVAYGWPDFQPTKRRVAAVDPAGYDRLAGLYAYSTGGVGRIAREGERLMLTGAQGGKVVLYPESERRFFRLDSDVLYIFNDPATAGPAASIEGRNLHISLTRIGEAHIDAATLQSYVGQYRMGPRQIFTVLRDGETLILTTPFDERFELGATSEGAFYPKGVGATITFVAEDGRVRALNWLQSGYDTLMPRVTDARQGG